MSTAHCNSLRVNIRRVLSAGSGLVTMSITPAQALDASDSLQWGGEVAGAAAVLTRTAVASGYDAAPALMLCLALAVAFPMLTVVYRVWRFLARPRDATRRYRPSRGSKEYALIEGDLQPVSTQAFVEVEGANSRRFAIPRDMFRIGREDDNDIRIPSGAVHRYHAAIHREDFDGWHITDLSGIEGNGIIVNGQRCSDARLADGDVIELGPGKLRFRAGFA